MYWHRSNAQIINEVLTECHSVDAAYAKLVFLRNEREDYINYTLAQNKRTLSEVLQADEIANDKSDTRQHRVLAEYHMAEAKALLPSEQERVNFARAERDFLSSLIEKLEPYRVYKELPDAEAFQKAQYDNMVLGFVWDVYIDLCVTGEVSRERFVQARGFSCFDSLLKSIKKLVELYKTEQDGFLYLPKEKIFEHASLHLSSPNTDKLKLLETPNEDI